MGRLVTLPRWGLLARTHEAHARDAARAEVRARTSARATWADVPDALRHAYAALDERDERIAALVEETASLAHERGARDDEIARLTNALAAARSTEVAAVPCDGCGRRIALHATWGDHTTIVDLLDAHQPYAPRDDRKVDDWNRQHADTCRRIVHEYRNRWLYPEDGSEPYIITRCGELGLSDDHALYG